MNAWSTTKKDSEQRLYIYKYSSNVRSASDFKEVQAKVLRPIETDRANAISNTLINETIVRLKEIHGARLRAHYEVWQLLATKICREFNPSTDPISYERAIQSGPDASMIHLFSTAYEASDHNLNNVRQNVSIGRNINNNVASVSAALIGLVEKLQEKRKEEDIIIEEIFSRLKSLDITSQANSNILEEVQFAHAPAEHPYGVNVSSQIVDVPDIDHN